MTKLDTGNRLFDDDSKITLQEEEHEEEDDNNPYEDRETLVRSRPALGLSVSYVPKWTPRDAFRELFQNWKDAIIETFALKAENFNVDIIDGEEVYVAEAHHPITGALLGFIRYIEKEGSLELTNFKASLPRAALEVGATSKRQNNELAGTHGEGFKIAALVMLRAGYQTRFETSNFYWRFSLAGRNNRNLYCGLTPISDQKLERQKQAYALKLEKGKTRALQNNIWEDVSVKIGRVHGPKWGAKIPKHHFRKWLKVAIDLSGTSNIIKTPHGSLILDEAFSDKIFLKGLLLEGQSRGKKFKYGYDTWHGTVGRDRTKLEDKSEELTMLANIWGGAIAIRENDCVPKYVAMLLEQQKWADVSKAHEKMSENTARAIWDHLQVQSAGLKQFYHDDKHGDTDIELIRKSLKKEPVQLPYCIWEPLRRFKHVRTPQEQRYYLLHDAPVAAERSTVYASMVERALRAALCLDPRTRNLELVFKDGAVAELDLLLEGSQLMVNDKWLDFYKSHEGMSCSLSRQSFVEGFSHESFSCDHIITELYDMVLLEIGRCVTGQEDPTLKSDALLRLSLAENLRQMPRLVETSLGPSGGEIDVTWMYAESNLLVKLHRLDLKCRVTLHRESTCSVLRNDLVAPDDLLAQAEFGGPLGISGCGCPQQIVSQNDSKVTFRSLDCEEVYFPMVSRLHPQAFYPVGLAPAGIRPIRPEVLTPRHVSHSRAPLSNTPILTPQKCDGGAEDFGDMYDESSASEHEQCYGPASPTVSEIESEFLRSKQPTSSSARCTSAKADRTTSTSIKKKELKLQLDKAKEELSITTQLLEDREKNIATLKGQLREEISAHSKSRERVTELISQKQVLEGKLKSTAQLRNECTELSDRLLGKYNEIIGDEATLRTTQLSEAAILKKSKDIDQAKNDYLALSDNLRQKDPTNFHIFGKLPAQNAYDNLKLLDAEKQAKDQIAAALDAQKVILQDRERLLQENTVELDTQRMLQQTVDRELRETKSSKNELQETLARKQEELDKLKIKNDELVESLAQVQSDLTSSLQTAARLSSTLYSPGKAVKRERVKEEETETPLPSSSPSAKRVRHGSLRNQASSPATNPIVID